MALSRFINVKILILLTFVAMVSIVVLNRGHTEKKDHATNKHVSDKEEVVHQKKEDNGKPSQRIPDAIVVGAGKCGTDALISYLNTSSVFVINTIQHDMHELNYFNQNYGMGTQWYIGQMPQARPDQVLIEKCAPYLWNKDVPSRVHSTKPAMKIIFVLCDPVKRLVSLYSHINSYKLSDGSDPLPPFLDIIQLKDGVLVETSHPRVSTPFLESGKYSVFVSQWLEYFPLEQMIFISGEELISDPVTQVSKVTKFLGKPGTVTNKNVYFDKDRGYPCFRSSEGSQWCMDRSTKGRRHPLLPSQLLTALHDHFRPYNVKLEQTIGIKFGWPKYFGKS